MATTITNLDDFIARNSYEILAADSIKKALKNKLIKKSNVIEIYVEEEYEEVDDFHDFNGDYGSYTAYYHRLVYDGKISEADNYIDWEGTIYYTNKKYILVIDCI